MGRSAKIRHRRRRRASVPVVTAAAQALLAVRRLERGRDSYVIRSPWATLRGREGVMGGAPADSVQDCEALYDEA